MTADNFKLQNSFSSKASSAPHSPAIAELGGSRFIPIEASRERSLDNFQVLPNIPCYYRWPIMMTAQNYLSGSRVHDRFNSQVFDPSHPGNRDLTIHPSISSASRLQAGMKCKRKATLFDLELFFCMRARLAEYQKKIDDIP